MMKEEFEKFVGETVSNEDYNVIETVYIWHPSISEVSGKDQISSIYRQFGMPVIHDMLETAMYAKELDAQRRQLMRCVDEIDQRFCKLQNGDLTEERCRKDADKLFTKSQNPQEWEQKLLGKIQKNNRKLQYKGSLNRGFLLFYPESDILLIEQNLQTKGGKQNIL